MSGARSSFKVPTGRTDVQSFTATGAWVKPVNAQTVDIYVFPVGGAGGSGHKETSLGTASAGGVGGVTGAPTILFNVAATSLAATVTVTVGSASTGGAAQTVGGSNGNPGTLGGTTSFGTLISVAPAPVGAGGSTTNQAGGSSVAGVEDYFTIPASGAAGSGHTTGAGTAAVAGTLYSSSAGGGGGGVNTVGTAGTGNAGGSNTQASASAGGTVGAGQNGVIGTSLGLPFGGTGGGGGAGNAAGAAGDGGNGGFPSGGGGGGGGAVGGNSGKGGDGGGALVVAITHVG